MTSSAMHLSRMFENVLEHSLVWPHLLRPISMVLSINPNAFSASGTNAVLSGLVSMSAPSFRVLTGADVSNSDITGKFCKFEILTDRHYATITSGITSK